MAESLWDALLLPKNDQVEYDYNPVVEKSRSLPPLLQGLLNNKNEEVKDSTAYKVGSKIGILGAIASNAIPLFKAGTAKAIPGQLNMMAGGMARQAPKDKLKIAEIMEAEGVSPANIQKATGIEKLVNHPPKWEIDDSASKVVANLSKRGTFVDGKVVSPSFEGRMKEFLQHDELYKNYPNVAGAKVKVSISPDAPKTGEGSFNNVTGEITVFARDAETARKVVLHEIQHKIQLIEGFARGSNPRNIKTGPEAYLEALKNYPDTPQGRARAYYDTYGEREARNTSRRADMTAAERQTTPNTHTMEIPSYEILNDGQGNPLKYRNPFTKTIE